MTTADLPKTGQTTTLADGVTVQNLGTRWINQYVVRRAGKYVGEAFNGTDAVAIVETGNVAR